ncbi:hypothetical protein [Rhizobium giardinii]
MRCFHQLQQQRAKPSQQSANDALKTLLLSFVNAETEFLPTQDAR